MTSFPDDACPFGDDAQWLVEGKNCSERVQASRVECYNTGFRARCCGACSEVKRDLPGEEGASDPCQLTSTIFIIVVVIVVVVVVVVIIIIIIIIITIQ